MSKLWNGVKRFFYALPFGLKGADSEIFGDADTSEGTVIKQQVNDGTVAKHLLKGEVTQEVEELRYRTYKVERESAGYEYTGNGTAIKKEKKKKPSDKIKFTQENGLLCDGVLSELNRIGEYGKELYRINIGYISPVRFKLEQFATIIKVGINGKNKAVTTLVFDDIPNQSNVMSKPFLNEINGLVKDFIAKDKYKLGRNDYYTSIVSLDFTTYKASNDEPDFINYGFINPTLIDVGHENGTYLLTYEWDEYKREDLTDKFYSKEMDEKYKAKAKKILPNASFSTEVGHDGMTCNVCGSSVHNELVMYDTDTKKYMCLECYKKHLLGEEK